MIIDLTDPNDTSVRGSMSSPGEINAENVLNGGFFDLQLSDTLSSESVTELFDLSEPPSFHSAYMVTAALDDAGALKMYLAPSTGDTAYAFAVLDDFRSFVDGSGGPSGGGTLQRAKKLPSDISWSVRP